MKAISAKVSSRYQVVIPQDVRKALGIRPQDTLLFLLDGKAVHIRARPASFTQKLRGLHRHVWAGNGEAIVEQERAAWDE